jgi:NADPH:quinone reductase-like Zn-dependent oxidoreductase
MKAMVLREHGGPEVLHLEELPDPAPGPGEVRVRVQAVALNHLDLWVRRGLPGLKRAFPMILGSDVAGTVDALGPGAGELTVGEEVLVNPGISCGHCRQCLAGHDNLCREYGILGEHRDGGYADFVVVPRANILPAPKNLSPIERAALPVTFLTVWQMLVEKAGVRPGETVLVHAASSGVGAAAVQVAKLLGAEVIATASSDEKLERARALGADHLVRSGPEVVAAVRRITGKRGADVVVEHVGAATWEQSILACAWGGRIVTCGATSGFEAKTDLRQIFYRQIAILGSTMGSKAVMFEVLEHVAAGRLRPVVDRSYPLAEAAAAHRRLESRAQFGKIVLIPSS